MALVTVVMHMVSAQGRGSSILRQGESTDMQSEIVTPRSRSYLSCESGDIVIKVNFTYPFRGLMYAQRSRNSPCRVRGTGGTYYELRIPLKGCGTWQEYPRVFMNNFTIRFHAALELEEDETITVVCRYPPPLTPSPGGIIVAPVTSSPIRPSTVSTAGLSEVEILIIICVLLFLSLLTLGIGISYFCLKRRNIRLVRRRKTISSGPGSEITKLSGTTTLGNFSLFDPIRIPRAIPYSAHGGSEAALLTSARTSAGSGSGPSDYPSDSSPSSGSSDVIDEVEGHKVSGGISRTKRFYDNFGFLRSPSSVFTIPKAILRKDPKRHSFPAPRATPTGSSNVGFEREGEDQAIATVLDSEGRNRFDAWNRNYAIIRETSDSINATVPKRQSPPLYAQVKKKQRVRIVEEAKILNSSDERGDSYASGASISPPGIARRQQETSLENELLSSKVFREITDTTTTTTVVKETVEISTPPLPLKNSETNARTRVRKESVQQVAVHDSNSDSLLQENQDPKSPPISEAKSDMHLVSSDHFQDLSSPRISVHDIDDVYVTTTVETESLETITTVKRDTVEEHVKTPTKWDVIIRQRSPPPSLSHGLNTSEGLTGDEEEKTSPLTVADDEVGAGALSSPLKMADGDITAGAAPSPPKFDVIIRAIPPVGLNILPLEKFSKILKDDVSESSSSKSVSQPGDSLRSSPREDDGKTEFFRSSSEPKVPPRKYSTEQMADVRDMNNRAKDYLSATTLTEDDHIRAAEYARRVSWSDAVFMASDSQDVSSLLSFSDSFHSEHSLGERSTSEVVEIAPTVRRRGSDHPMLERSTSEIITSPQDFSRWSVVPVFENFSPEFLASIPVIRNQRDQSDSTQSRRPTSPLAQQPFSETDEKDKNVIIERSLQL